VAVDAAGNLYFPDRFINDVRKVAAGTGVITTVAGTGTWDFSGDGGRATEAALRSPSGVAVDAAGNLFIADTSNNRVRRVDARTGRITTVAGTGISGYGGDGGPAVGADLLAPYRVAVDAAGNLYITDSGNLRVRKVDAVSGTITTVAGTGSRGYGGDNGPATDALLAGPGAVALDAAGNLFIVDPGNQRVRKVSAAARAGSPVAYTITVRNTSPADTDPVTVTSIASDPLGELIEVARAANGGADIVLDPSESFTFSAPGPVLDPGTVVMTVTVTAHDDEGTIATASHTETLTVI
jgi:streptogramin lyase